MSSANGILPTIKQNLQVQIASPIGYAVLVGAASILVLPPNAARRGVKFYNPSAVTIYVCPSNIPAVIGQGIPILPSGGPEELMGDGELINYNCGWNAIAAAGANNPLTILEFL